MAFLYNLLSIEINDSKQGENAAQSFMLYLRNKQTFRLDNYLVSDQTEN
jgi:hypothetical protein